MLFLTLTQSFPKVDPAKSLSFLQLSIFLLTLPTSLPSPIASVEVLLCVVGAIVVCASVVGASVVGATVVGATVVGAIVAGASVVGATVVGPPVVGATVVGTSVVGSTVVGAAAVGVVDSFVVEAVVSSILIFLKLIFVPASTFCPNSNITFIWLFVTVYVPVKVLVPFAGISVYTCGSFLFERSSFIPIEHAFDAVTSTVTLYVCPFVTLSV